ncbi:unnamed protein product [Cunninghamella echinulata]
MTQNNHNENTPLLHPGRSYEADTTSINSYDSGHITILTSRSRSILSDDGDNDDNNKFINNEDEEDDIVAKRLNGVSLYVILLGLWIGVSLSSLDSSIVATIYAVIGSEFKRISDIFGRKNAMLFAVSFFFIGSYLCGASTSIWYLVIARCIAGIGGGGINTLTTVIISDLVPLRERGKYQGYGNIAYGLGSVVGAPIGGFLTDTIGWRYCFYINLPFLLITLYVTTCLLTNYNLEENKEEQDMKLWQRLKKIDYAGAFTIVTAVVAFLIATSLGGNIRPWSDPLVVSCLIASAVLLVLFCIVEANWATNPLMPWPIISSRTPLSCSLANFWIVMANTAVIYITPLYFQGLLGYTPTQAGLYYIPKVIFISLGSVFCGLYMSRTGEYLKITILGAFVCLGSMIMYTFWTPSTSLAVQLLCICGDGLSLGVVITTTLIAMLSCVGSKEMATITSMSYLFRSAGGVIGISATSAIFQATVKNILTKKITGPNAELYIDIARKSMTEVRELLPADILDTVLDSYQTALQYSYGACVVMALLGLTATFFIQRFELMTKVKK